MSVDKIAGDVYEKARNMNLEVVHPEPNEVFLDIDNKEEWEVIGLGGYWDISRY